MLGWARPIATNGRGPPEALLEALRHAFQQPGHFDGRHVEGRQTLVGAGQLVQVGNTLCAVYSPVALPAQAPNPLADPGQFSVEVKVL